jgi:hypothetical protein
VVGERRERREGRIVLKIQGSNIHNADSGGLDLISLFYL